MRVTRLSPEEQEYGIQLLRDCFGGLNPLRKLDTFVSWLAKAMGYDQRYIRNQFHRFVLYGERQEAENLYAQFVADYNPLIGLLVSAAPLALLAGFAGMVVYWVCLSGGILPP